MDGLWLLFCRGGEVEEHCRERVEGVMFLRQKRSSLSSLCGQVLLVQDIYCTSVGGVCSGNSTANVSERKSGMDSCGAGVRWIPKQLCGCRRLLRNERAMLCCGGNGEVTTKAN